MSLKLTRYVLEGVTLKGPGGAVIHVGVADVVWELGSLPRVQLAFDAPAEWHIARDELLQNKGPQLSVG